MSGFSSEYGQSQRIKGNDKFYHSLIKELGQKSRLLGICYDMNPMNRILIVEISNGFQEFGHSTRLSQYDKKDYH
ncbi:hypothetical protein RIR_jg42299.t2 [Rhizophagus irregularis DAOM 181602=DAOM 197198]|nr:hypothetical protein RIR_jg42299.t2 [Rhizophagus irregularis DAOM 181602=DAOM 197198]